MDGKRLRVVCYVNQFFGQLGGEDKAGVGPQAVDGAVGMLATTGVVVSEGVVGVSSHPDVPIVSAVTIRTRSVLVMDAPHGSCSRPARRGPPCRRR